MRDDDRRVVGAAERRSRRSATMRSASMSSPESVSSRIASFGSSTAICRISLRFFSPPEKPAFTERVEHRRVHVDERELLLHAGRGTRSDRAPPRRAPCGSRCTPRAGSTRSRRRESRPDTGRRGRRRPARALRAAMREQILAVVRHGTAGDVVRGVAGEHLRERALARAVRAHDGVDFAALHGERDALEDLLSPTVAWRSLISSKVMESVSDKDLQIVGNREPGAGEADNFERAAHQECSCLTGSRFPSPRRSALPDTSFERDPEQLLRLERELHRQFLEHFRQNPETIIDTACSALRPRCFR